MTTQQELKVKLETLDLERLSAGEPSPDGLVKVASNMYVKTCGATRVLFSYETPVAAVNRDGYFRTEEFFSVTTSQHINKWFRWVNLEPTEATYQPQAWFGKFA